MNADFNRRLLVKALGVVPLGLPLLAKAQGPVARIFVGFPPGGTADILARHLGPALLINGNQAIVENKPGASGQIAATSVRQAPVDGFNILLTPTSILTLTPQLYRKPLFDPLKDFIPLGAVCDHPFALAVSAASPIKSLAEFVARGKAQTNGMSFASPGAGTSLHFWGLVMGKQLGVAMTHVGYRGTAPGLNDLMGGQVDSTFNALPSMVEFHRAGKIRILAHTNPSRLSNLPDVPTFTELGVAGLEYVETYGMFAAAGMPAATVVRLEAALQEALAKPAFVDSIRKLDLAPRPQGASAYKQLVEADFKRWTGIAKDAGFTLDN